MAAAFPPSEPELAELSTCGDEADTDPEEDMEGGEDFAVELGTVYSCRKADGTYHDAEVVKMRTNKRAKREEYMVRYVGATRRQTEWVDKSRLLLVQEDAEEGSDQEISENDQTLEYQKPDEDEPKTKRAKVEDDAGAANSSIMSSGDFTEELTCLLCDKLYEDPVMVECGHNFCRSCIDKAWVDGKSFSCPDCKEALTEKTFTTNRVLANLMKKTAGTPVKPVQKQKVLPVKNCPEHEEKLKLYCKDDGDLCCIICQDSLKHVNHTYLPILEAEEVYRAQLSGLINPLEEALTKTEELAVQYSEKPGQYKSTAVERRHHVVSEFEKLYNFLKERKEKMLEQFKEQSQSLLQDMWTNASKMEETRDYLREALAEANERMNESNSVYFLSGMTPFLEKVQEQRKAVQSSKDAITEQDMCRGTFKGPIQYIFWKQMKSIIGPIPECDEKPKPLRNEDSKDKMVTPPAPVDSGKDGNQQPEAEESDEEAAQVPEDSADYSLWIKNADLDIFPAWMYRGRREIWIVGDGYVTSVCRNIEKSPYNYNLGFPHPNCNVRWLSSVKLWSALMPKLKRDFLLIRRPSLIFIHLGNCDLKRKIFDSLNNFVANYLTELSQEFRKVDIVLSALLPRKEWMGTSREDFRKGFNANLCQLAAKRRFQLAQHEELEQKLMDRFKNGVGDSFITSEECNMFVKDMRDALLRGMVNHFKKISEKFAGQQGTSAKPSSAKASSNSVTNRGHKQSTLDLERPVQGPVNPQEIVWLVGNAYVSRAQRYAEAQVYGANLGFKERFCKLHWLGRITRWNQLVTEMKKAFGSLGKPSYIFLHLGTDDLEATSYEVFVNEMRSTLSRLTQLFPKVKFILSTVLPMVEWVGSPLEECRMMINTRLGNYAERHGFQVICFDTLSMKLLDRFRSKDRHSFLSPSENEMFITIIKDVLLTEMLKNSQAAIKK